MRIAIVNDMVMAVEVLRRVISEFSPHEIAWTALDGREAVELCAQDPPDLILMDLIMPLLDGAKATQIIMNLIKFQSFNLLILNKKPSKTIAIFSNFYFFSLLPYKIAQPLAIDNDNFYIEKYHKNSGYVSHVDIKLYGDRNPPRTGGDTLR